jgi:hypothetical protein
MVDIQTKASRENEPISDEGLQNPWSPSGMIPHLQALQPGATSRLVAALRSWVRTVAGLPPVRDLEHEALIAAFESYFKRRPDGRFLVMQVADPIALLIGDPIKGQQPTHRFQTLNKDNYRTLTGSFVVYSKEDLPERGESFSLQKCALLIVPKSLSKRIRECLKINYDESVFRKVLSKSSFSKVLSYEDPHKDGPDGDKQQ